jgi:uncharacterized protein YndB with AHSA1/START domain
VSTVDITKDLDAATLTVSTVLAAAPERVWYVWADPRQLERWWGPDPYPATVIEHDLRVGGHVSYVMTGPEGERYPGYWRVTEVAAPWRLAFEDGFADADGQPDEDLPVSRSVVTIEALDDLSTRMTIASEYDTAAELEQVLAMGMEQGIRTAFEQIHTLLAEG